MFADDTLPFRRCSRPSDVEHCCSVQEDTPRLGACADECNNHKKSARPHPALSLSRCTIPLVSTTTHLGVRLCCSLLWSEHAIQRVNFTKCSPWNRTPRSSIWILQLVKHLYLGLVPHLWSMLCLCGSHALRITCSPWDAFNWRAVTDPPAAIAWISPPVPVSDTRFPARQQDRSSALAKRMLPACKSSPLPPPAQSLQTADTTHNSLSVISNLFRCMHF